MSCKDCGLSDDVSEPGPPCCCQSIGYPNALHATPVVDEFVHYLRQQSEFDRELLIAHVRKVTDMGKIKLP